MNTLGHSVLARSFRLYPRKWNGNKALRVELYGLYIIEGQCTSSWFKNLTAECSGDSACGMNGFCPRYALHYCALGLFLYVYCLSIHPPPCLDAVCEYCHRVESNSQTFDKVQLSVLCAQLQVKAGCLTL